MRVWSPQLLSNSSSYVTVYVCHSQDDARDIRQILLIAAAAAAAADDDDADADAAAASLPVTQLMMFIKIINYNVNDITAAVCHLLEQTLLDRPLLLSFYQLDLIFFSL